MFKTSFDRSPLVITLRLILLLVVLAVLAFIIYTMQYKLMLGNRKPALPTMAGALLEPRPTPHDLVIGTIPLDGVNVKGLRFVEQNPADANDPYEDGTRFAKSGVYFLFAVLDLEYAAAPQAYKFQVKFVTYKNGAVHANCTTDVVIEPPEASNGFACGTGAYEPGSYPVGIYYVEALYEGGVVANGGFEITEE